ncbi:cytochrome P450 [Mycobacterium servetii]|uniref:Cytochrome P450 n=1 Tax=Mycobacterium servetii TaxID=3237418 RepID=A0ABV4C7V8_9MYCO
MRAVSGHPALHERDGVVALLLRARDETGRPLPDRHVANELVTLLVAGYETTSAPLAWAVDAQTGARGTQRRRLTLRDYACVAFLATARM